MATVYKNGSHTIPPELRRRNRKIVSLAEQGKGAAEIAELLGMTRQRVHQIMQRARNPLTVADS